MGYMRHHAIVVTSSFEGATDAAHEHAVEIGCTVTPVVASTVNGYRTFVVVPDGSKEGWEDSNEGNQQRTALVAWLQQNGDGPWWFDWVEVQYGDDDLVTQIVRHSDADDNEENA